MGQPTMNFTEFDKCFIDADSILYRVAATTPDVHTAIKTFDVAIMAIMEDTVAKEGFVAVKGSSNFRDDITDTYKASRKKYEIKPDIKERLDALYEYCWETDCVPADGCEADDLVSIWASEATENNESFIIAHIDKDIDMIAGWHFNYNRNEIYHVDKDFGHYLLCKQLLTGDSSDSIEGLKGIGPKRARNILKDVAPEDMFEVVKDQWRIRFPRDWEEKLELCFNLIYMRRSFDDLRKLSLQELFDNEKQYGSLDIPKEV